MDTKKFEQLINMIINEDEENARALFHDIVVEKSREIYENLMDEEELDESEDNEDEDKEEVDEASEEDEDKEKVEEGFDEVDSLLDEISSEEGGMTEEEDEFGDIDVHDDAADMNHEVGNDTEEEIEDRVVELEDKLDQLMAEFEEMMGGEGHDMGSEEDMGDEEGSQDFDSEGREDFGGEEDEGMMEAINLKKVSVTHGDNGQNSKSIVSSGPKVSGNGATAANLNKGFTDSGKGGTTGGLLAPTTKDVKGAGTFKNVPGKDNFSDKGEAAPKPKHGDDGQNKKSVIESRKTTKKIIRK